ncbi:MAG: prepilin-type N-terminal cleavage/methylation domain-containing protein [Myxococcota bacterium]
MGVSRQRREGFSLVELLIASAVLGIVVIYLVQTFTTTQKTYVVVDQVSEAQQNLRVVADLMERDLRLAGYLVPGHAAVCGVDRADGPDTLFVSNSDVILPADELEVANYDALLAGNLGAEVSGAGTGPGGVIGGAGRDLPVNQLFLDVAANGNDFSPGSGVILVDRNDPDGRTACGTVTGVGAATVTVDFVTDDLGPMSATPDVVAVPAHVYTVTPPNPGLGIPGQLFRNGVLIANDVEDLQIAFFFDLDDDRILDPGEYQGDLGDAVGDGVAVPYDSTVANARFLRQVEISLVTSTRDDDPSEDAPQMIQQTTGNRDAATLDAPDRKRRRVYNSTVRMRNV